MSKDKNDIVDVIPATGIMFIIYDGKPYMVVAYEKDNNYVAISISVDCVLKNLTENKYITDNAVKKPKDTGVV
jgi:hypothetical protein